MSKVSLRLGSLSASDIQRYAREDTGFDASELRGRVGVTDVGLLDEGWVRQHRADRARIGYTVLSFATPIAWLTPDGWVVVTQRWGTRTSRHQGIVRGLHPQADIWCPGYNQQAVNPGALDEQLVGRRNGGRVGRCPECGATVSAPQNVVVAHLRAVTE